MAISRSEIARAERREPIELADQAPEARRGEPTPRKLSVVVPLLNEEATLEQLYRELETALASLEWEVVFVDDGSTDGSYRELVRLHAAPLNVRLVDQPRSEASSTLKPGPMVDDRLMRLM